jgi:flavin-dependent dehydrogenase
VLLLDRARFPRDKPCGGGVTIRAARLLPFSLDPVVEDVVDRIEARLRFARRWERVRAQPLALMTRRSALDAFLAERAAAAGADFRDGVRVTGVSSDERRVTVRAGRRSLTADALIGADGANGIVARSLGLCHRPLYGVALEGNVAHGRADRARYAGRFVFELGFVRGGYGWIFPKRDHVNVGVGGWAGAAACGPTSPPFATRTRCASRTSATCAGTGSRSDAPTRGSRAAVRWSSAMRRA